MDVRYYVGTSGTFGSGARHSSLGRLVWSREKGIRVGVGHNTATKLTRNIIRGLNTIVTLISLIHYPTLIWHYPFRQSSHQNNSYHETPNIPYHLTTLRRQGPVLIYTMPDQEYKSTVTNHHWHINISLTPNSGQSVQTDNQNQPKIPDQYDWRAATQTDFTYTAHHYTELNIPL